VNIFDENIPDTQRQLIKSWRIRIYQMGNDVGQKGIKDQEFLYFLLTKHKPVFFTRDLGFYKHHLCHPHYCLVCLAVTRDETAIFIRRLFNHPEFETFTKQMGTIIRVSHLGLYVWQRDVEQENFLSWSPNFSLAGL